MEYLRDGPSPTLQADALRNSHPSPNASVFVEIECSLKTLDSDRAEAEANLLRPLLYDGMAREKHLRIILAGHLWMQLLHRPLPSEVNLFRHSK